MISHDKRCIFVHIPKTAGTSIEKMFGHFTELERGMQDHRTVRELLSVRPSELWSVFRREGSVQMLREVRGVLRYPERMMKNEFDSYYKFAIVRNPWARVLSWYKNIMRDDIHKKNRNVREDLSFEDFLIEHSWHTELRPQLAWLTDREGNIAVDYVGRFEALQEAVDEIAKNLKMENLKLPHLLDGGRSDYREQYTDTAAELVSKRYSAEIAEFGYSYDEVAK